MQLVTQEYDRAQPPVRSEGAYASPPAGQLCPFHPGDLPIL